MRPYPIGQAAFYHRGFVADLFSQVPDQAPVTDLPVYLREERAARATLA